MTKKISAIPSVLWTCGFAATIGANVSGIQSGVNPTTCGIIIGASAVLILMEWVMLSYRRELAQWVALLEESTALAGGWREIAVQAIEEAAEASEARK